MPFGAILYGLMIVTVPAMLVGFAIWALVRRPIPGAHALDPAAQKAATRIQATYRWATVVGLVFGFWAWSSLTDYEWVIQTESPGLLAALGPSITGLLFLLVVALLEATWPRPSGVRRSANLVRRPAVARAAAVPRAAMWAWSALLAVALVIFGVIAGPDGRTIANAPHLQDPGGGWSGPFPGWPYGVPLLIAAALLIAASLGTAHLVARRPAVAGLPAADDEALRITSATRIAKATQLAMAVTCSGVLWFVAATSGNAGWWWAWPCAFLAAGMLASGIGIATRPAAFDEPSLSSATASATADLT